MSKGLQQRRVKHTCAVSNRGRSEEARNKAGDEKSLYVWSQGLSQMKQGVAGHREQKYRPPANEFAPRPPEQRLRYMSGRDRKLITEKAYSKRIS